MAKIIRTHTGARLRPVSSLDRTRGMALAAGLIVSGLTAAGASAQGAVVGNLRLATDASGTPMETVPAGPGEKVYALESGDQAVYMAFDFSGSSPVMAQLRLMGPMGIAIHQDDIELVNQGPYVVEYDPPDDRPLAETEYVVNVYVEAEGTFYLADSLQMTVGDAQLSPAVNEMSPTTDASTVSDPAAAPADVGASVPAAAVAEAAEVPGPSTMLLMLAGVGVIGLLAVVAWAGMSAMKSN